MKKIFAIVLMILALTCCSVYAEEAIIIEDTQEVAVDTSALDASAEAFEAAIFESVFSDEQGFEASVSVSASDCGSYFSLKASVDANANYTIDWEINDGSGWRALGIHSHSLKVMFNAKTAGTQYRAAVSRI